MSSVNCRVYQVGYKNNSQKAENRIRLIGLFGIALLAGVFYSEAYSGEYQQEKAKVVGEYYLKATRHVRFLVESGPDKGQIADENTSLTGDGFLTRDNTYYAPGTEVEIGIKKTPIFKTLRASAPTKVLKKPDFK